MNIGVLGTGFGAYHVELYKRISSDNNVKVYGRNIEKLKNLQERFNVEITTDVNEILHDKNIELIDVCMPNFLHKKYVIESLKNGKDVFCETPVAVSFEDAIEMEEASKKYNKKVFVDNFIKFEPAYKYLYDTVQNKSLGQLKVLHLKRMTPPFWGDLGVNNIVTNLMIHEFDFVSSIFNNIDNISALSIEPKEGTAHCIADMEASGALITIEGSTIMPFAYPFTTEYEAVFEEGYLVFKCTESQETCESSLKLFIKDDVKDIELNKENCYELSLNHVINCIKGNEESKLSLESAMSSLKIALEVKNLLLSK